MRIDYLKKSGKYDDRCPCCALVISCSGRHMGNPARCIVLHEPNRAHTAGRRLPGRLPAALQSSHSVDLTPKKVFQRAVVSTDSLGWSSLPPPILHVPTRHRHETSALRHKDSPKISTGRGKTVKCTTEGPVNTVSFFFL